LVTSARVGGDDANPTNVVSSTLEFGLSSVAGASDEQYVSIPDDEIALLARKLHALHKQFEQPYFIGRRKLSNGGQERATVSTPVHA
jgi:hypothetical protein